MPGVCAGKTVPIKVQIGLRPNGHADHPDWNTLPMVRNNGEKPEDHMCGGWIYDKSCGHAESRVDSPLGTQWGILIVSEQFADEAVATFSNITEITDEKELRDFIEGRCTAHMDEFRANADVLQSLKAERDLVVDMKKSNTELVDVNRRIAKAMDVDDPTPGRTKTKGKKWTDMKSERNIDLSIRVINRI
jgi:hypothetical protein